MYQFKIEIFPAPELDENAQLSFLMINLIDSLTGKFIRLLKVVLEDISQLDLFIENKHHIRNDQFPIYEQKQCSLAEVIAQFYEDIDPDSPDGSKLIDDLYDYQSKYGLRFVFRGQDIPNVYIGLNKGHHEISCLDDESRFRYRVNIESFFEQIRDVREKYLDSIRLVNQAR